MGDTEDINLLDSQVAHLKIEYEQYFMRVIKREPLALRSEVEAKIRLYSTRVLNNTGAKFKLASVVAKYNSYKQYWTRTLRAIEEGTYRRSAEGVGSATRSSGGAAPATKAPKAPTASKKSSGSSDAHLKDVFDNYIAAKKQCNESVAGISLEGLKKSLADQKKKLGAKSMDLSVNVVDGKAKISIKANTD